MKTTLIRELQGKLRDHPEMRYSGSHFCHQDVNFGVLEEKICDFWLVITITLSVFCCTYGCNLLRYWNVCDVMIYVSVSEGPRMKSFMTCVCQTLAPVASLVTKLNFCSYCWFFGGFFCMLDSPNWDSFRGKFRVFPLGKPATTVLCYPID